VHSICNRSTILQLLLCYRLTISKSLRNHSAFNFQSLYYLAITSKSLCYRLTIALTIPSQSLCIRFAIASISCIRFKIASGSLCDCIINALRSLHNRFTIALQSHTDCFTIALQSDRFTIVLQLLYSRSTFAPKSLYNRFTIVLQSLYNPFASKSLCNCITIAFVRFKFNLRSLCNRLSNHDPKRLHSDCTAIAQR
jgi:hypothetical protein